MIIKLSCVTVLSVVLLGACGATTGSVANSSSARAVSTMSLQASQSGDASKTCTQLTADIAATDTILAEANAAAGTETMDNLKNSVMKTAVTEGVVRSGAARSVIAKVPFGGALFNSALNAKSSSDAKKRARAAETAQNAVVRRSSLMGIYTGKGCS